MTVSFDTAARKLQEDLLAHAAKQPAPPRAQWSKTLSLVQAIAKREEEASQKLCSQAKTELKSEDVPKSGAKRQPQNPGARSVKNAISPPGPGG